MKEIIDGKRYDTDTAEMIAEYWNGVPSSDFQYLIEVLYKTKNGAYFLSGEGGAMTRYSRPVPTGGMCGGSRIIPMGRDRVIEWLERTENYETLELLFPDSIEDA